eukprot:6491865-Amphidinium_carterae.1
MDSIMVKAANLEPQWYLNMTCWGTRLQQVYHQGPTVTAEAVTKGFMQWVRCYGLPEVCCVDGGPEFKESFADLTDHLGVFVHQADSYAPHQSGKTERAGGLFKQQLHLALETAEVGSVAELEQLAWEICNTRNTYIDRSGFSAHQRVFGKSLRQPVSLMAEDHLSTEAMALNSKVDFTKAQELRTSALTAMFQLDAKTRIQRASRAKTRNTEDIKVGQWIFIHRKNAFNRHWREGPAAVVMVSGVTVWATMRGNLYKVNKEMVRTATTDELRGIEELNELLPELREETKDRRTRKAYRDYTGETAEDVPRVPRTPRIPSSRRPSQTSTSMGPTISEGTQQTHESMLPEEGQPVEAASGSGTAQTRAASEDIAPRTQRRRLDPQ